MCLLITKPAAIKIKKEYLEEAFRRNGDGAGVSVAMGDRILLIKPLWKFEHLWKVYQKFEDHPMIIHCRIKTHGSKCRENTHPHWINEHLAMGHNGIINCAKIEGDESDTRAFIREYIAPVVQKEGHWGAMTEENRKAFDYKIGTSKLAFMNKWGKFFHVNKIAGHEAEGCWWSNYSYKANYVRQTTTNTTHQSNYRTNVTQEDYRKELVYCIGCRFGHQRRNTEGWFLSQGDCRQAKIDGVSYNGLTIHVCHSCCKDHEMDETSTGWQSVVKPIPQSLVPDIKEYLRVLHRQEDYAKVPHGTAGNYTMGNEQCCCCGLKLPEDCFQPFYDPTKKDKKIVRHICRSCIWDIGQKNYYPAHVETVGENSKIWKEVVNCRFQAQRDYEQCHPVSTPYLGPIEFPEWIEKAKNLLAKKPEPPKIEELPTEPEVLSLCPTANGRVWARGWACTMCGELRMTMQTASLDRLCQDCFDEYENAGYSWSKAVEARAARLNIAPKGTKLILPPIPGKELGV